MNASSIRRGAEVSRLRELLVTPQGTLDIVGVYGPGGVGKSYLLAHVLDGIDARSMRRLRLSVDGANKQTRGEFFNLVEAQLLPRALPSPAKAGHDYFPRVRRLAAAHARLVDEVAKELREKGAPRAVKDLALALLRAGHVLNKSVPKSREYLDLGALRLSDQGVSDTLDVAWGALDAARALRDSTWLPGPVANVIGQSERGRLRSDLYNVVSDALISDLSAALAGYQRKDWLRFTEARIDGVERLLIVLDDFEALAPVLGEFVVSSLVPKLARARFQTTMVVLCRDDLAAMHPGWSQHCKPYIRDEFRLRPFDRESALSMLSDAGVPEDRREALYAATQGFPFLLSLVIEEAGEESALFLRKFHDRTTRWMTEEEQGWFRAVCYLDAVNEDTLLRFFPPESVERVQSWFERESSIRDPGADAFRVRPLIKEKVLRYFALRSPSRHREMLARGRGDGAGADPAQG